MFNGVVVGTYSEAWENSNKHHPPLQSVPGTGSQQITPSLHANYLGLHSVWPSVPFLLLTFMNEEKKHSYT